MAAGECEGIFGRERGAPFNAVSGGRSAICVGLVLACCFESKGKDVGVGFLGIVVERSRGDFSGTVAVLGCGIVGVLNVSPVVDGLDFTTGLIGVLWPVSLTGKDEQVMNCVVDKHKQIKIHNYCKNGKKFRS